MTNETASEARPRVAIPDCRTANGSRRIPIADVDNHALRQGDGNGADLNLASIGDLVVQAFTHAELLPDVPHAPEHFESFERACLSAQALELRALSLALANASDAGPAVVDAAGGPLELPFTKDDAARLLAGMARRTEALAELSKRLRVARWGDPHFGGGDLHAKADA